MLERFLTTGFEGGRHERRVNMIKMIEENKLEWIFKFLRNSLKTKIFNKYVNQSVNNI